MQNIKYYWRKIPNWPKHLGFILAWIYFINKGQGLQFLLISTTILIVFFHRQLWKTMQTGAEMYVRMSELMGDKLYSRYNKLKKKKK